MRQAEHKERVRQANSEAQLQILGQDLSQVTEALSKRIKERDLLEQEVAALELKKTSLLEESAKIAKLNEETVASTTASIESAKEVVDKANKLKDSADKYYKTKTVEADEYVKSLDLQIAENSGTIQKQEAKIDSLNRNLISLENLVTDLKEQVPKLELDIRVISDEVIEAKAAANRELSGILKQISEGELELSSVQKLVAEEVEKIKLPMLALEQETIKLEKKKRDLDIYHSRIITQFRKAFPGQQIGKV